MDPSLVEGLDELMAFLSSEVGAHPNIDYIDFTNLPARLQSLVTLNHWYSADTTKLPRVPSDIRKTAESTYIRPSALVPDIDIAAITLNTNYPEEVKIVGEHSGVALHVVDISARSLDLTIPYNGSTVRATQKMLPQFMPFILPR